MMFAVVALSAACGGGGDSGGDAVSNTTAPPVTTTTTLADPTAEVTALYTAFFDGTNPDLEAKIALVESPDVMRDIFTRAFNDPAIAGLVSTVQAQVVLVTPTSDTTVDVDYNLLVNGEPATPGTFLGRAVLVDGEWRVSASTLCNIIGLANPAYGQEQVCIDASAG